MKHQSKLKIKLQKLDRLLEVIALVLLIGIWIYVLIVYQNLPDTLPTHFNAKGQADNYGSKSSIFMLPIISIISYIVLSILIKYPHRFNYPIEINEANIVKQYTYAIRLIRSLKVIVIFIFGLITVQTINNANNSDIALGIWFLPTIISLVLIPSFYYLIKSSQTSK